MKIISIGRNPDNDIVINDNMISRRHAVVRISPLGKYEIISYGANGTKVNGNQIVPNHPYPIKRGDSVTFANVTKLNWNKVPNPMRPYQLGGIGFFALLIIICAFIFIPGWFSWDNGIESYSSEDPQELNASSERRLQDSLRLEKKKDIKEKELKELPDFKFKPKPRKHRKENKELKEQTEKKEEKTIERKESMPIETIKESSGEDENISNRY